jgi:hypothetical protein
LLLRRFPLWDILATAGTNKTTIDLQIFYKAIEVKVFFVR